VANAQPHGAMRGPPSRRALADVAEWRGRSLELLFLPDFSAPVS
jgi:hypothetical protein